MIDFFTKPASAHVFVIEPMVALRSVVVEALRNKGFSNVKAFGDLKTLLDALSSEPADWILSASCSNHEINIMHLLKMCIEEPRLRNTRVSLLMRDHEGDLLPLAFEWGLLSYHNTTIPSRFPDDIGDLLRVLRTVGYNGTLTAENFLRRVLKESRSWAVIARLARTLLETFPGSPHLLLSLAEAELNSGREEGRNTLQQVLLVDPSLSDEVQDLAQRFPGIDSLQSPIDLDEDFEKGSRNNALGLECCMLIDPDTSVHHAVRLALREAGVENIYTFESGQSAWDALKHGCKPALIIMVWRIPDLSGLQLVQRLNLQAPGIPIILISSLVTTNEMPLLKEFGVNSLLEKPFEKHALMSKIVTLVQQHRYPTEQAAMDQRILTCLRASNKTEAGRLIAIYLSNPQYDEVGKLRIEAEFEFFEGKYRQCCETTLQALKFSGDSVELLNLLGKSLMKLGEFESAMRFFEKSNVLAPKNIERICQMVSISTDMDNLSGAEELLAEAKAIDANNILVIEAEANLAIESDDQKRAAEVMKGLDSFHRIAAYINNKAVAKIRNNLINDGIKLYRTALGSLPEPWNSIHDTVCFNLSLAHIRALEYEEATNILLQIKACPSSVTGQKVSALCAKIEQAIRTKTQLHFSTDTSNVSLSNSKDEPQFDLLQMIDQLTPVRGDICCYRSFQANEMASEASRKLLLNMPKLVVRPSMRREE
ncbi:MAG: response regulator, partial [Pseudobdellovibrionaceae bacterium]|nr:response regulator [Pseudobdellovibrionaceae bacterium]